jgi:hypothetical protein
VALSCKYVTGARARLSVLLLLLLLLLLSIPFARLFTPPPPSCLWCRKGLDEEVGEALDLLDAADLLCEQRAADEVELRGRREARVCGGGGGGKCRRVGK